MEGREGENLASRHRTFSLSFPLVQRRSSSVGAWEISCLSVLEERLSGIDGASGFSGVLDQGAACDFPSPFQAIKSLKLQQTAEWPPFSLAVTILLVWY